MKLSIVGCDITRDDAWLLEIAKIPEEMRAIEPDLQDTRWFDYRSSMPIELTQLFAVRYVAIYQEFFKKLIDTEKSDFVNPLFGKTVFDCPDLVALSRARQAADSIGCKYDFYIRFVFNRCFERGWQYMPRPNQFYGEELVPDAYDAWEETKKATLQLAVRKRFSPEYFCGHPDQIAYHEYLVGQIKLRAHPYKVLGRLVFKDRILPLNVASKHFNTEVLNRAKASVL